MINANEDKQHERDKKNAKFKKEWVKYCLETFGEMVDGTKTIKKWKEDAEKYISMRMDDSCGTLYEGYEKYIRLKERLKKEMVELPIFCRICGEKLSLSSSAEPTWGCSYLGDDGKKENRHIADKHYSDSRSYLSFSDFEAYERVFNVLQNILEGKDEKIQN